VQNTPVNNAKKKRKTTFLPISFLPQFNLGMSKVRDLFCFEMKKSYVFIYLTAWDDFHDWKIQPGIPTELG